jgi:hypothetical protein
MHVFLRTPETTVMTFLLVALFSLISLSLGHEEGMGHQLSSLYKDYQRSYLKSEKKVKFETRKATAFATEKNVADLFLPPLPGQSPVDFHPQLKYEFLPLFRFVNTLEPYQKLEKISTITHGIYTPISFTKTRTSLTVV